MHRRLSLALLALAAGTASGANEPQWLQEARAREAALPEPAVIESKDGRFKARVPARVPGGIVATDDTYGVELPLGEGVAPVFCEIYPEGVDMANGLRLGALATFEEIGKSQGKIEGREIERTDAGWNGAAAFLKADWLYAVQTTAGKRLGALKQAIFERDGLNVYCVHNELGYVRTFERLAQEFATSLEWTPAAPPARFREVHVASVNERKVGIVLLEARPDAEGDARVTTTMSILVPMGGGEVAAQDEIQVEFVTGDRALINAVQVVNANGEIGTNVRLDPGEDGDWDVTGQFNGKDVASRIPGEQVPRSSLEQFALVAALLQAPEPAGRSVSFPIWSDANPTTFTDAEMTALARREGDLWNMRMKLAGLEIETIADARDGSMSKSSMPLGHLTMTLERVARQGQP